MSRLIKWDLETVRKQFQNHTHVSWTTVSAATIAWLVTERRRPSRIAVAVAIVVAHLQPMQRGLVKERLFGSSHFQPLMYILSYTLRTAGGNKKYCIVLHRSIGSISSLLPQRFFTEKYLHPESPACPPQRNTLLLQFDNSEIFK